MRAARRREDDPRGNAISVRMPRVSPRPSAAPHHHADLQSERSAEAAAAAVATRDDRADKHRNAQAGNGIPAQLLADDFIDAFAADARSKSALTASPPAPNRRSPSPPPQPASPARDVGGTLYFQPPLQPPAPTPVSALLVHRLNSFLPPAARPPTRSSRLQAGTEAVKITCNGPALDRFPLSVQGGLSSQQVNRARTPAYEPRVAGQERQPLAQTWLVPSTSANTRAKVPPVTFRPREALGWEAFQRVEHKDAAREAAFSRADSRSPLAAGVLEHAAPRASAAGNERARRRGSSSARWGNPPVSLSRSALLCPSPKVAGALSSISGSAVVQSAPLIVSSFKKALLEWDAAAAATADPFLYINAKAERVTCSPSPTRPPTSLHAELPAADERDAAYAGASAAHDFQVEPEQSLPQLLAADERLLFKEASSLIFAAAERASPSSPARSARSPNTVRISEHGSAFDETPDACSSPSSSRRSVAYRPILPDQIRAAILFARPHTLASAQRPGIAQPSGGRRAAPLHPFKKVVIGRALPPPLSLSSKASSRARAATAPSPPGYALNTANYRAPTISPGKSGGAAKRRDAHLAAVHGMAQVLELNAALAAAAAAMQLPTRAKEMLREIELLPPHSNSRTSCALSVNNLRLSG